MYAINPFQVRSFARSLGQRAKTDAVDARMLAMMASAIEDLRPAQAKSEGQRDLAELQQIRDALRKDRTATSNRGRHLRTPVGKRVTRQRLRQIERQLKLIDAEIRQRVEEDTGRDAASSRVAGAGCASCCTCPRWLRSSTIPTSGASTKRSWLGASRRRSP